MAANIGIADDKTLSKMNINDTYSHFEDELSSHLTKLLDVLEQEKIKPVETEEKKKVVKKEETVVVNTTVEVKEDELYTFYKNFNIENRFSLDYNQNSESIIILIIIIVLASELNHILGILDPK